jgi:hypothetical protein
MTARLLAVLAAAAIASTAAVGDEPLIDVGDWRPADDAPRLVWGEVDWQADAARSARFEGVDGRFVEVARDNAAEPHVDVEVWPGTLRELRPLRDPLLPALADYQHAPRNAGWEPGAVLAVSVLREIASDYEEECERMGGALVPGGCVAPYNLVGGVYER